jgi:hypothetical protein
MPAGNLLASRFPRPRGAQRTAFLRRPARNAFAAGGMVSGKLAACNRSCRDGPPTVTRDLWSLVPVMYCYGAFSRDQRQ